MDLLRRDGSGWNTDFTGFWRTWSCHVSTSDFQQSTDYPMVPKSIWINRIIHSDWLIYYYIWYNALTFWFETDTLITWRLFIMGIDSNGPVFLVSRQTIFFSCCTIAGLLWSGQRFGDFVRVESNKSDTWTTLLPNFNDPNPGCFVYCYWWCTLWHCRVIYPIGRLWFPWYIKTSRWISDWESSGEVPSISVIILHSMSGKMIDLDVTDSELMPDYVAS